MTIDRAKTIEMARECGTVIGEDGPDEQFEMSMKTHDLERFAALVRAEVIEEAYNAGWIVAASWAKREDLHYDMDSAAFKADRAEALRGMKSDSVHPATADAGASTAPPSAWQPIETVPRTGLSVLAVCAKYGSVFLAHWANGLVDSSVHDDEGYRDRAAIAWMPLPRWDGDMEGRRNG